MFEYIATTTTDTERIEIIDRMSGHIATLEETLDHIREIITQLLEEKF
jgi:hypothetical protein